MELSASVKDVVEATREYTNQQSEANLTKLQRNLDAVNGHVSRDSTGSIFKGMSDILYPRVTCVNLCLCSLSVRRCLSIIACPSLYGRHCQWKYKYTSLGEPGKDSDNYLKIYNRDDFSLSVLIKRAYKARAYNARAYNEKSVY